MGKAKRKLSTEEQYAERLDEIRSHRALGAEYDYEVMILILELEKRPSLWRDSPKMKFDTIVNRERFCTVHRWQMFKRARTAIPKKHLLALGVPASCLIAAQPKRMHLRLLRAALDFRQIHGVEPTYQYVAKLTRKKRTSGPTRKQLLRYIEVLQTKVVELGGKVPDMED
jgi:hypothetical protein